MTQIKAESYA